MPEPSDIFGAGLKAIQTLDASSDGALRLSIAQTITRSALSDLSDRDAFGLYALRRIKAWMPRDPLRILADYLVLALSESSGSQESASAFALNCLTLVPLEPVDVETRHQVDVIVEVVLDYYSSTCVDIDLYPLSQMLDSARGLPARTKSRVLVKLLKGQDSRGARQLLGIRRAVEHLFGREPPSADPITVAPDVAREFIASIPLSDWARWLPELKFGRGDRTPFAIACKAFLAHCFDPAKPELVLALLPSNQSGRESVVLLKASDLRSARNYDDVRRVCLDKGQALPDLMLGSDYLEPDFLERECRAMDIGRSWIDRQIVANNTKPLESGTNVLRFRYGENR